VVELTTSAGEDLFRSARAVPPERLDEAIPLPWAPGMTDKVAHVLMMPYWQFVYHLGQMNYVQIMYGDRQMR
jgi:hypothetical protein